MTPGHMKPWSRFRLFAEALRGWGKPFRFAGIRAGGWVTFPAALRDRPAANDNVTGHAA